MKFCYRVIFVDFLLKFIASPYVVIFRIDWERFWCNLILKLSGFHDIFIFFHRKFYPTYLAISCSRYC